MRPERTDVYLALAEVFSLRGTCPRAKVGAVIIHEGHVIAHGYNGAPAGLPHCNQLVSDRLGNFGEEQPIICSDAPGQGCTNAIHAEENAIAYAARVGVTCRGADLYCTHEPCIRCARLIVATGIKSVTYSQMYRSHDGIQLLAQAAIPTEWRYIDAAVMLGA